jgi:hypothetical protein
MFNYVCRLLHGLLYYGNLVKMVTFGDKNNIKFCKGRHGPDNFYFIALEILRFMNDLTALTTVNNDNHDINNNILTVLLIFNVTSISIPSTFVPFIFFLYSTLLSCDHHIFTVLTAAVVCYCF